jgi:hypothetical protein
MLPTNKRYQHMVGHMVGKQTNTGVIHVLINKQNRGIEPNGCHHKRARASDLHSVVCSINKIAVPEVVCVFVVNTNVNVNSACEYNGAVERE